MAKWGLFMGFLFALWFGGWFAIAHYADNKIGEQITAVSQRGIVLDCKDREIRGFPFRMGVFCADLNIAHKRDVFRFEFGELMTAAQLYDPGTMVAELKGPFKTWSGSQEISASWNQMRVFLDANLSGGFEIASLNFSDFSAAAASSNLKSDKGALHFRPTPLAPDVENQTPVSLDVALNLDTLNLDNPKLTIPPATLDLDATLIDGYADLIRKGIPLRSVLRDGAEFTVRNLKLSLPDGGRLAFSGPITISENGLVSGKVKIGIADPDSLGRWASSVDPRLNQAVSGIAAGVSGMGSENQFSGETLRSITVTIDKGVAKLGFITLANIPPLFQN